MKKIILSSVCLIAFGSISAPLHQASAQVASINISTVKINVNDKAPIQSAITVSPMPAYTTLQWTTNVRSRSKLYYDTKPLRVLEAFDIGYEPQVLNGFVVTLPTYSSTTTVELRHLTPRTTYYYLIQSVDKDGNVTVTWPATFTTQSF
jgi:hypothetical protein